MSAPFTKLLTLDFETAWSRKDGYSLSYMTTEEYIRDPRFKAWGVCIHEYGTDLLTQWYGHDELPRIFSTYDWSKTAVLAQNTVFDASILSWHYDVHPVLLLDTLSMARAKRGVEAGNSLEKLAKVLGLPEKGRALESSDGYLDELPPEVLHALIPYCKHDVWLCEQVFDHFIEGFPASELRLIDMTLKMFTEPVLKLDADMLVEAIVAEKTSRESLLKRLGVTDDMLASNDKFAEVLRALGVKPPTKPKRPTKKTPHPVGELYAFAKTDAMFQAMLEGDNDDVAALCEARLKVKSTTERTRAQRFYNISQRGPLPVPLSYFGAGTGRWTALRGEAINMQNLKRGSFLRKAIMAPDDHVLVVGDLSQIEPRVLAWLSDYEEMLEIFRQGGDPYASFGAQMFNIVGLTKDSHPIQRQSAKSALLGCFGPRTPVLTPRGWVPIVDVRATDTVWDGKEWVCHQGVLDQGEKDVLTAHGVSATSDHEILTEHGWVAWSAVLASPSLWTSARLSASSPAFGGSAWNTRGGEHTSPSCDARVGGKGSCTDRTSAGDEQRGATAVPSARPSRLVGSERATSPFAQTETIASACSTASARSLRVARIPTAASILTTAGAVLRYTQRGLQTASRFFGISSPWTGGISPRCSSTERTTTGDTNPATFASSHAVSTCPTNARSAPEKSKCCVAASPILKQRMRTYDIAHAGPRNRFTILTDQGPLVVHNCGYQLGWASFAAQLLVGFLGAPPKRYTKAEAKQLGINMLHVKRFLDNPEYVEKMLEIPHICTMDELVVHCVVTKAIVDKYRATAEPVTRFWSLMGDLIEHSLYNGNEYTHKCLTFRKEEIEMPNGMKLCYPGLHREEEREEDGGERGRFNWVYGENRVKLYPGKVTNNVTQGLARIVMTDGMLRVHKRYPVKGTVHDELIAVAPKEDAAIALPWVLQKMTITPSYMPGLPLAADGGVHRRYGLAKN